MKFLLFLLLLTCFLACSGEIEKGQPSKKKMSTIESPPANSMKPQSNPNQEHISGNGEIHISGAPSSSHVSGQ